MSFLYTLTIHFYDDMFCQGFQKIFFFIKLTFFIDLNNLVKEPLQAKFGIH
jgi:hypothetical protein